MPNNSTPLVRLAIFITHPIQYCAPLFRRLAREPDIELTVFYASDISLRTFYDPGYGQQIRWDVPLLEGYQSEFLPAWGKTDKITVCRPWTRGLGRRLRDGRFDWIMIHGYARPPHWFAALVAKTKGVRVLFRDEATLISQERGLLKRILKRVFFSILDSIVDGFLVIGTLNRAYYIENGIAPSRLYLTPYSVDNAFFRASEPEIGLAQRRKLGIPERAPVIFSASRLASSKHIDQLISAFLRLESHRSPVRPHLVVAGDGDQMGALRELAAGRTDIHFLGFQGQHDLIACYAMCDIFVLPSSFEPWGLVVNEAMNLGKAIIVSDQVGCGPDLVRPGENGLVYRVGDVAALAEALDSLCRDPELVRSMGQRSLEIISAWDIEADVRGFRQALGLPETPAPTSPAT